MFPIPEATPLPKLCYLDLAVELTDPSITIDQITIKYECLLKKFFGTGKLTSALYQATRNFAPEQILSFLDRLVELAYWVAPNRERLSEDIFQECINFRANISAWSGSWHQFRDLIQRTNFEIPVWKRIDSYSRGYGIAIAHLVKNGTSCLEELLRFEDVHQITPPDYLVCYGFRGLIDLRHKHDRMMEEGDLLEEDDLLAWQQANTWIRNRITQLCHRSDTTTTDRDRVHHLVRSLLRIVIEDNSVPMMEWLLELLPEYLGRLAHPTTPFDLELRELAIEPFLQSKDYSWNPLLLWAIEKRIFYRPEHWRTIVEHSLEEGLEEEIVALIVQAHLDGEIVMNPIGLFYRALDCHHSVWLVAQIDPMTCTIARSELGKVLQGVSMQSVDQILQILAYCTQLVCPCQKIAGCRIQSEPFHQGPLPIQANRHALLRDAIQWKHWSVVHALAHYSRSENLPIFYYATDRVVLVVRNPCETDLGGLAAFPITKCFAIRITVHEETVIAVPLEGKAITEQDALDAIRTVFQKRAE